MREREREGELGVPGDFVISTSWYGQCVRCGSLPGTRDQPDQGPSAYCQQLVNWSLELGYKL
jgi:hypothetical protein